LLTVFGTLPAPPMMAAGRVRPHRRQHARSGAGHRHRRAMFLCDWGQALFGKWSALDIIVSIMVGSSLSRAWAG
jgi:hypothetical protein